MIFKGAAGVKPITPDTPPQIPKKLLVDVLLPKDFDLLYAVTA